MPLPRGIVTGASGFVGRHLLDQLKGDHRIVGVARRSQRRAGVPEDPNITWLEADIAERPQVEAVFRTLPDDDAAIRLRPGAGNVRGTVDARLHTRAGKARRHVAKRAGIYIVPTDRWYIERTVWLIAGLVLLVSTSLAALVDPRFIVFVSATGITSVVVAFTGFCPVGNVLSRLGFTGMLSDPSRRPVYVMRTDSWYLERRIYVTVGVNITIGSILSLVYSPWWLAFTGFVGVAMVWFSATGFCILANILYWTGAEPRLAPPSVAAPAADGRAPVR
jgi:hypothetical protein